VSEPIHVTIILHERVRAELNDLIMDLSCPDSPRFGESLTRKELRELVALGDEACEAVRAWLRSCGMEPLDTGPVGGQALVVRATEEQIANTFGRHLADWLRNPSGHRAPRVETAVPRELAGYIQAVHGLRNGDDTRSSMVVHARGSDADRAPMSGEEPLPYSRRATTDKPPTGLAGVTPADIRRIYNFPDAWTGEGQTIALLMMGGDFNIADLRTFWRAHGIRPPEVRVVRLGPSGEWAPNPMLRLEASMTVEWVGAMAPGAKIVVYIVDPDIFADPWAMFLLALAGDEENAPTVATTSWITPERRYYRSFGSSVVSGLLDQVAALGITVISAAGDWGAFDGVPRSTVDGYPVSDAPWPHGVFPAVEERVLGVGGTMITSQDPLTELAWSGPPPHAIARSIQFTQLASSGGFSEDVPIPTWQAPALRRWYARGTNQPAVVPYGRGYPDVALMASGPSVQRGEVLSALGYQAVVDAQWIDYAGGTSIAAPIWAAIIARANQARAAAGKGTVGFVNPLLYAIRKKTPAPFRDVTIGQTDVSVRVVNVHGKAVTHRLDGYSAGADWDPVTGLGVPNVANLIQHLTEAGEPIKKAT
jgi:kumamolisin